MIYLDDTLGIFRMLKGPLSPAPPRTDQLYNVVPSGASNDSNDVSVSWLSFPKGVGDDISQRTLNIAQSKDKDWAATETFDDGNAKPGPHLLVAPPHDLSLKYVYAVDYQKDYKADVMYFALHTIRYSNFINLSKDSSLKWTTYKLNKKPKDYPYPNAITYLITEDKTSGARPDNPQNLLLLELDKWNKAVLITTVKLRPDGAIKSSTGRVDDETVSISMHPNSSDGEAQDVMAHVFSRGTDRFMFILWTGVREKVGGMLGQLNVNGTVSSATTWDSVRYVFKTPIQENMKKCQLSSLLVPKEQFSVED